MPRLPQEGSITKRQNLVEFEMVEGNLDKKELLLDHKATEDDVEYVLGSRPRKLTKQAEKAHEERINRLQMNRPQP